MRALWLEDRTLRLREDAARPSPPRGEALVRVRLAGVCNTDLELVQGYYPYTGVPGHEFVGVVEDVVQSRVEAGPRAAIYVPYTQSRPLSPRAVIRTARPAEAIKSVEKSMQLDPQFPALWLHFLGHAHFMQGDYEQAATVLKRRIRREPETDISRALLASCYGHLGLVSEAKEEWARLLEINPDYSIERKGQIQPYKNPVDWDRIIEGLREVGLQE